MPLGGDRMDGSYDGIGGLEPLRGWRQGRLILMVWFVAFVIAMLLLYAPRFFPPLTLVEKSLGDLRANRLLPPQKPHPRIVLVTITEETFAEKAFPYRSPFDRKFLAKILFLLHEAGVRAVGVDLLIDQPTEPEKDDLLKQVIDKYSVPLFFSYGTEDNFLTSKQVEYLDAVLEPSRRGMANLVKDDQDGVVRYIYPGAMVKHRFIPGLANALAGAIGKAKIRGEPMPLIYRRAADPSVGAFVTLEAHHVELFGEAKRLEAMVRGKIVIIGGNFPTEDQHLAPIGVKLGVQSRTIPGVMVHAHGLAQLLDGYRLKPAPTLLVVSVVMVMSFFPVLLILWSEGSWATRSVYLSGLLFGYEALAFMAPGWSWYALPMTGPFVGFILAVAGGITIMAYRHRSERRFIEGAFSRFVSPNVLGLLQQDPTRLKRGGERREVSLIFTDVAGFTTLSEETEPEQLVATLNDYLEGMSEIVLELDGTLDKYIGDGMVVLFGAPLNQDNHAGRAIECALKLNKFAWQFSESQRRRGIAFGQTRIGVHSGPAIVGNIGSHQHLNYTSIGDAVNTASRLEGAGRHLGARVLISGETVKLAGRTVTMRRAGALVLKGRHSTLPVFEPWDDARGKSWHGRYEDAYEMMARGDTEGALKGLTSLLAIHPDDGLAAFHAERLRNGETGARVVLTEK